MLHRCNRKEKNVRTLFEEMAQNKIITMVVVAGVADTIFGCGRSIRERKFNSCVGIDGAIRKIAMVISIVFLGIMDLILKINLIAYINLQGDMLLHLTHILRIKVQISRLL